MSRIDITSSGAPLSDGILQTANPLDATLQVVTDNVGTSSTLLLSTAETQVNSTLRIKTDNSEILDIENSSGNRFNINRNVQNINLDFASKPTDLTTQVGAIRTAIDGTNLADVIKFQENGQVTLTERVKIESDSTVTTQTSSVIQATTTNANLVLAPNGSGAIVASIPDGTIAGGNARGSNAVDLQTSRSSALNVASAANSIVMGQNSQADGNNSISIGLGAYSQRANCLALQRGSAQGASSIAIGVNAVATATESIAIGGSQQNPSYFNTASGTNSCVIGGYLNTASSNFSTISGGQSNTASTNTHATVVGGQSNTASGQYAIAGGFSCTASGQLSLAIGRVNTASGQYSTALGNQSFAYQTGFLSHSSGSFTSNGDAQQSLLISRRESALITGATTVLSLDGSGTSALIIPNGNNRAWNVTSSWVAVVTAITGTATGISVGDVVTSVDLLGFKRVGGTSSASAHTSAATKTMVTTPAQYAACAIAYSAGASQEMAMTFTGPTFIGGGSVTMRVVARIELSEVAW